MIVVRRRYRYVVQDRDRHGNLRTYLRMPGKAKLRLHETPGTPEFDAEYRRALEAKPETQKRGPGQVVPDSLRAACIAYRSSAEFKRMAPRSQHVRWLILDHLFDQHGDKPAKLMEPRHVRRLRDEKAEKPEAANALVKSLRAVFRHAVATGEMATNPAEAVPYIQSGSEGFHTWTIEEVRRFEARWPVGTTPRLALALMLYTGVRRSDAVKLGRQHVRDGHLHFLVTKGARKKPMRLVLPILPELAEVIAVTPGTDLTFLRNGFGRPFTPEGFTNVFRKWVREAGIPHCTPHGLRKAAAVRLAEMGCTAHEIMAVLGHTTLKEAARYTAKAERQRLASSALSRLSGLSLDAKVSHPSAPTPKWDENATQHDENKGEITWKMPRGGIEPPTLRFSVACSTN